jgi:hypothetical protein
VVDQTGFKLPAKKLILLIGDIMGQVDESDYIKILDLQRIYGSGTSDILNLDKGVMDLILVKFNDFKPEITKKIHSSVRLYWKVWMGKHRETK